ncbi:MAG TPA: hypothetical protein PLV92_13015, partial [Pirellulaceae bacterium]|nr:hypothetical protein [Pirellulaceae bacterium]
AIGNRNSRLWKLSFSDLSNPLAGGTIEVLINGKDTAVMFDNITMDKSGRLVLQEDVGNDARLGQIWMYDTTSGALVPLAQHRPEYFVSGNSPSQFLTQDEESSGVIDVSNILGEGAFLLDVQAHYGISTATSRGFDNPNQLVEGGQLVLMKVGALAANGYLANDSTGPTDLASNASVVILGTNGADTFSVTPGNNGRFDVTGKAGSMANGGFAPPAGYFIVNGYGGNDWIDLSRVPSTPSRLYGGDGIDSIRGTDARDRIYGGAGIDNLYGNAGDDDLFGGDGIDYLFGGAGADRLQGDAGVDLFMYDAFDTLVDYVLGRDAKIRWF